MKSSKSSHNDRVDWGWGGAPFVGAGFETKSSKPQSSFGGEVLVITGDVCVGFAGASKLRPQSSSCGLRLDDLEDVCGALGPDARASMPAHACED